MRMKNNQKKTTKKYDKKDIKKDKKDLHCPGNWTRKNKEWRIGGQDANSAQDATRTLSRPLAHLLTSSLLLLVVVGLFLVVLAGRFDLVVCRVFCCLALVLPFPVPATSRH